MFAPVPSRVNNFPKIVTIQNEYSLMCRHFDLDLAEVCHHEKIGLLSFSPLACGLLSGKYSNNKIISPASQVGLCFQSTATGIKFAGFG